MSEHVELSDMAQIIVGAAVSELNALDEIGTTENVRDYVQALAIVRRICEQRIEAARAVDYDCELDEWMRATQ